MTTEDTPVEIQRRAADVWAWYQQGLELVKRVDLARKDGADLVRFAGSIIVEATRRRYPYAGYIVNAVGDVVRIASHLAVPRSRYIDVPHIGVDNKFAAASCAEAGGRVDIAYALTAEADHCIGLAREGSCPHRRWELLYRAPAGTTDHYHPRSADVPCPVHGTKPGYQCP